MKPHTRRAKDRHFEIPCRITRAAVVTVRAADATEAGAKFTAGDWAGEEPTELTDWTATGPPKELT